MDSETDVLIVGGGLGGVAATLSAARLGVRVILVEETDWIGGQLTVQGVPLDEHRWIESTGCTRTYRELRNRVREYYRQNYPLLPHARDNPELNPGMGFVSRLCHEPRVGVRVLEDMLTKYVASGVVRVLLGQRPIAVASDRDRVNAVTFEDVNTHDTWTIEAKYVLDATELGDLLELGAVEHVIGAEAQSATGEPHALERADPLNQQAITWCFALEYRPDEDHTIARPASYAHWETAVAPFWPGPQLSWTVAEAITGKPLERPLFTDSTDTPIAHDLWHFRRLIYRKQFPDGFMGHDVTLANWAALDYWEKPLLGVDQVAREQALESARELSLSFLHWMQTDAPRHDGGTGYPGLRLRGDVMGTKDGLAKRPYFRESRRIAAEFTVVEQHVGAEAREGLAGAEVFPDTVGVGAYRIDLHPSTGQRGYVDIDTWPFQIPLGALLPVRVENLLPAAKNIGTTHITNGCYRLHPVEWNIGESAGALAAFCIRKDVVPRQVRANSALLEDFQSVLSDKLGVQLAWPMYEVAGPKQRFGSPSAIHGGSWLEQDGDGWRVSAGRQAQGGTPG